MHTPLYTPNLSRLQRDLLYKLYTRPFDSLDMIAGDDYHYTTLNNAMTQLHGKGNRLTVFTHQGYVHVPSVFAMQSIDLPTYQHLPEKPELVTLLDALHYNPAMLVQDLADNVFYTAQSIVSRYFKYLYDHFGFEIGEYRSFQRLRFYAHMGWFDYDQLAIDAFNQYGTLEKPEL